MILLLARRPDDPSLQRLSDTIRTAGGQPVIVTLTEMEQLSSIRIQPHAQHGVTCTLHLGATTLDLRDIRAAWLWRHWQPLAVDPSFQAVHAQRAQWGFVDQEWRALYRGFIMTLAHAGVFCVNPPPSAAPSKRNAANCFSQHR